MPILDSHSYIKDEPSLLRLLFYYYYYLGKTLNVTHLFYRLFLLESQSLQKKEER